MGATPFLFWLAQEGLAVPEALFLPRARCGLTIVISVPIRRAPEVEALTQDQETQAAAAPAVLEARFFASPIWPPPIVHSMVIRLETLDTRVTEVLTPSSVAKAVLAVRRAVRAAAFLAPVSWYFTHA